MHGNFDIVFDRFPRVSQLHFTLHTCAVRLLGAHVDRVLIGAWNLML